MSVQTRHGRRWLTAALTTVAVMGPIGVLAPAVAVPKAVASSSDLTSTTEALRVDTVPTPELGWYECYGDAQCATVMLPLDYDQPNGAKTEVSLLRRQARDKANRIGSLFVNPGGPGGSGTEMAFFANLFLSPGLLAQFDIVGLDPRGTNFSDQAKCFTSNDEQTKALKGFFNTPFPVTRFEEQSTIASAKRLGAGCSSTGKPLTGSMSTAQVARDMDVLRRAVGDTQLSFFGLSYGSYLGQVYANMFPDRVRAVTIDGVLDPVAWAGTSATASLPQTDRIRSADGAYKALLQILRLCKVAGLAKCPFATGDPVANFDLVANRLKKTPLVFEDPSGGPPLKFTYADLVNSTLGSLYSPDGYAFIVASMADLIVITEPPAAAGLRATAGDRLRVLKAFAARLKAQEAKQKRPAFGFPYDNATEAFTSVLCTDGLNPANAASWPKAAAAADRRAKYFGRLFAWQSVGCASNTWTAQDEDAYRGPFNHRTASPILVVGSKWDPATNYEGAVKAASLLPNSRLLVSDNWGHTAYTTSECATSAIDTYLLTKALPAPAKVCRGDVQPFVDPPISGLRNASPRAQRPPVVPPVLPGR